MLYSLPILFFGLSLVRQFPDLDPFVANLFFEQAN